MIRMLPRSIVIYAGGYRALDFKVDNWMYDPGVAGWFNVSDASGEKDDVIFYVCDEDNFLKFEKGEDFIAIYQSDGRVSHDSLNEGISESGYYYLIYDNQFSASKDKVVWGDVRFTWISEPLWVISAVLGSTLIVKRYRD